jgi:hypothetical protein
MNEDSAYIIKELSKNSEIFKTLLIGQSNEEYLWKQSEEKWCLLEIICHLYDEEREDFRARTKSVLETPGETLVAIDPVGWIKERSYIEKDYDTFLRSFLIERAQSISWLQTLASSKWDNVHLHPKLGSMSAKHFLSNWLAHDYLHIRQIIKLKFDYLKEITGESLNYAGDW